MDSLEEYRKRVPSPQDVLQKSQRNDLFRAIEQSGVPLAEFELRASTVNGQEVNPCIVIDHRHSQSYFAVEPLPKGYFGIFGRLDDGEKLSSDTQRAAQFFLELKLRASNKTSWPDVPPLAKKWAQKIIEVAEKYANTPDLWTELGQSKRLLAVLHENIVFTKAEQAQVSNQMQQIKAYILTTYELTTEQLSDVEERLDHVEEASRRLGRKDWLVLFNGAFFSLMLADLIPPQAVQHILTLAFQGIGHLFGLGGPPTPLP